MRTRPGRKALAAALPPLVWSCSVALFATVPLFAQTTAPANDDRITRLERRLDEMERRHQAELQDRDREIARLKALLPATAPTTPPGDAVDRTTQDILGEIGGAAPTTRPTAEEVASTRGEVQRDAQAQSERSAFNRTPVSFNPDLAVISDFVGNASTDHRNPAMNRFDVREVELDFRAAVDPRADAVAIIPIDRSIENPLFFNSKSEVNGHVDTSIDIEEAYMFLHDFGIPNLTAKVGRFHLRFGRWNILHQHDWVTTDNNFVSQSFLGPESLVDEGVSLSYVIPPKLIGDQYVEVIAEVVSGEGDSENPVFNNDATVSGPALNTHVLWNHDFGRQRDWNLELGASWMTGHHNADNHQAANLYGVDATLIHTDPTGRFNNQLIQFEAIHGDVDTSRTATAHSTGAFLLLQQQLNRDVYAGVRFDWTQNAVDEKQVAWDVSPYLTWYWSEFLRFRVEYQHKQGVGITGADTVYVQGTWIFGAHPPHPYWAVK